MLLEHGAVVYITSTAAMVDVADQRLGTIMLCKTL